MNLKILNSEDFIFFSTRDYAFSNGLTISAATEQLKRLEAKKLIVKLTRGIWANINHPYYDPNLAIPYLLNNEQGYLSFLSALNLHGMISQIPQTIQVASTGRSRKLKTQIANYEFIQLNPNMLLAGIDWAKTDSQNTYLIASSEKALLDVLYVSTRKGNRFISLPELDLNNNFSKKKFKDLLNQCVIDKRIKNAILLRFEELIKRSRADA